MKYLIIALWTNGFASDEDVTAPADLTCGTGASAVTAIDVLHGFEQELDHVSTGGQTVINGLNVPDYPLLVRLSQ